MTAVVGRTCSCRPSPRCDLNATQRQADLDDAWTRYQAITDERLIPLSREQRLAEIVQIRTAEVDALVNTSREAIDTLAAQTVERSQAEKAAAVDRYTSSRLLVIVLIITGLVVGWRPGWVSPG